MEKITETYNGITCVYMKDRTSWRRWLTKNHHKEKSVWLIIHHKNSATPSIYYDEAVEEALCFGWIDSTARKRDEKSKYQYFTARKPNSNWSKLNRQRAESMIQQQKMTPAGQAMIDLAISSGAWTASDSLEGPLPPDLAKAFDKSKTAFKNFNAFPPSARKLIVGWVLSAKRPETRKGRIRKVIALAKKNLRAFPP